MNERDFYISKLEQKLVVSATEYYESETNTEIRLEIELNFYRDAFKFKYPFATYISDNNKVIINEKIFSQWLIEKLSLNCINGRFYSKGKQITEGFIKKEIQTPICNLFESGIATKTKNLFDVIKNDCYMDLPKLSEDIINCNNVSLEIGTDGGIECVNRPEGYFFNKINADYNENAKTPELWLKFLNELLTEEDILTLQEYIGYCFLPTTKGQKALFIVGKGGEGKSCIGVVLGELFGNTFISDKLHKLEEDKFLIARLQNKLLFYDDNLNSKKLTETGTFKTLVTNKLSIQAEAKGKDKFDLKPYTRFISCGNQALSSCFDKSDGFYRRLIILTCKVKPEKRKDDRFLCEKLIAEKEGIFNWCLEGLLRLVANDFEFTMSEQATNNVETLQAEDNNIISFMSDTDLLFKSKIGGTVSAKKLYDLYKAWCFDNGTEPLASRTFMMFIKENQKKFGIEYKEKVNDGNRRVRGYYGIEITGKGMTRLSKYYCSDNAVGF